LHDKKKVIQPIMHYISTKLEKTLLCMDYSYSFSFKRMPLAGANSMFILNSSDPGGKFSKKTVLLVVLAYFTEASLYLKNIGNVDLPKKDVSKMISSIRYNSVCCSMA